jgi:plastocyanin
MRVVRSLSMILALSAALSCQNYGGVSTGPGGGGGGLGGGGGGASVQVGDNVYTPAVATVKAGETITWTWVGANAHSVTFNNGPTSATQITGTFQASFSTPGTYFYSCIIHGTQGMGGSIVVQ